MERGENPFELSGNPVVHQWASQGWNWLYGRPSGSWGCQCGSLSKKWIKQAAHMCFTQFYTPLQTELNLSSLPIIPLVNLLFHLISVVLCHPRLHWVSILCVFMERALCEINSGVIFVYICVQVKCSVCCKVSFLCGLRVTSKRIYPTSCC